MARIKTSLPHPRPCGGNSVSVDGLIRSTPNSHSQSSEVNENLPISSPSPMGDGSVLPSMSPEVICALLELICAFL